MSRDKNSVPFPIAYISAWFPRRSETFVYREVRALRARGWDVKTISLYNPSEPGLAEFADLEAGNLIFYESGMLATLVHFTAESLTHPIRSVTTFLTALRDAIAPGEPTSVVDRVKLLLQSAAAIGAARPMRGASAAHIHAHFAHASATAAMYLAKQLGVPFSFTGHANDLFKTRKILRRKLQRAKFVACISEWHREFYKNEGADVGRCHVVRCGVPVDEWKPRQPNLNREKLQVLTVCRLVEKKGVDMLLRALQEFGQRTTRPWKLTIAGGGEESDKLKALAADLGIAQQCDFLGPVSNNCVRELLMTADCFALPCRTDAQGDRDGIPVVLMEAMACGVPVISGDLPAVRELIADGESGLLVDGTNPSAVADAIEQIDRDESLVKKIVAGARNRVETEFSLEENISRLEKLLGLH
jgi:colanic acid/amylovoran biosynthesis glycosyltransferase